jgi:hypothetical protein
MLMTEIEATDKRCCTKTSFGNAYCIASACMAWRWRCWVNDEGMIYYYQADGSELHEKLGNKPSDQRLGYCGLAGKGNV